VILLHNRELLDLELAWRVGYGLSSDTGVCVCVCVFLFGGLKEGGLFILASIQPKKTAREGRSTV
jgi:hypothetical protein